MTRCAFGCGPRAALAAAAADTDHLLPNNRFEHASKLSGLAASCVWIENIGGKKLAKRRSTHSSA
ncbi:hypothetical protein D3C84_541320 [compost metagenome]